jgi:hypothetical protein
MTELVITLVHGTWGRGIIWPSGDAPWTTDASTLCRSLRERLGPDTVFRRFRWSGSNSHSARLKASHELRDFLQEGLKVQPDATHIVVAHSHGGNVALMALGDANLRERFAGVACLATPFIAARDRNLGRVSWAIVAPGSVFLFAVFLSFGLLSLFEVFDPFLIYLSEWSFWGLMYTAYGLVITAFLLLRTPLTQYASRLRGELSPRPLERDRLLLIRSPADEASLALAVFQFFSQGTVRLLLFGEACYFHVEDLINKLAQKPPGELFLITLFSLALPAFPAIDLLQIDWLYWLEIPAVIIALILSGALFGKWLHSARFKKRLYRYNLLTAPRWPILSRGAIWVISHNPFVWLLSVPLAALIWLIIIPLLSLLLVLPFGWQVAFANILLDVTADTTPPGSWEIHLIEPPTSEEVGAPVPPLMHWVYENPRVLRKLGEWIETRSSGRATIA